MSSQAKIVTDQLTVDFWVFIVCLLISLTCLEETEPAVEMEEVASCNPSENKGVLSSEPQNNSSQKKRKKKKMAHTFGNQLV